ncbi:MAG: twin-arginine translocase TatA/TatE family subunit [Candidatus Acidiferrales bacterium]
MGPIGIPELIFIFLIALLIFGPKKLPELGRNVGKALTEFRRASNDLRHAVEEEMREVERQAAEAKRAATEAVSAASLDEIGSIDPHVGDPRTGDTRGDDTHRVDPHAGDTRASGPHGGDLHAGDTQGDDAHSRTETVPADSHAIGDAPSSSPAGSQRYEKPAHGDV